ncbi:MAG: DUF4350 domain-containing protein [Alkalinema sp. CAN_BIN05]|nr:DUF4350 domain-containing protein [Alkalinema sp. CAN_BIN05]
MQSLKQALNPRQWWTLALTAIALILLTLINAPSSPQSVGSSYSKTPEGYGAWYEYMEKKGTTIDRLRKPNNSEFFNANSKNTTFIQIAIDNSSFTGQSIDTNWIEKGNRWIIIGATQSSSRKVKATKASFTSQPNTIAGPIKIDTTRRLIKAKPAGNTNTDANTDTLLDRQEESLIQDDYGTLVMKNTLGKGELIYIVPQFIAANAYQLNPGNFKYLSTLAKNDRIWIDEYLHGYRDIETAKEEGKGSLFEFLAQTPIMILFTQLLIGISVLIYGKNCRFGKVKTVEPPPINNSLAYIRAMAGILQKANSTDFVTETLSKAEITKLQRNLGLGTAPQAPATIIKLWTEKTGRSSRDLEQIFNGLHRQQKLSEAELIKWLTLLQNIAAQKIN